MKLAFKVQVLSIVAGVALLVGLMVGCQSDGSPGLAPEKASPAMLSADGAGPATKPAKGRAQIWAETCNRCHNTRSPDSYNGRDWAVVMTHMRVRGYLTGEDQRAILQFLQQ
jgi:hypothetical protein